MLIFIMIIFVVSIIYILIFIIIFFIITFIIIIIIFILIGIFIIIIVPVKTVAMDESFGSRERVPHLPNWESLVSFQDQWELVRSLHAEKATY